MTAPSVSLSNDTGGRPVNAVEPSAVLTNTNTSGTAATAVLPAGLTAGQVCRISCTQDCYILFGTGADADEDDTLFPTGVEYFRVPQGATHFSVLQVSTAGRFSIQKVV